MNGTLVTHNGALCVLYETTLNTEPVKRIMLWAVVTRSGNPYTVEWPDVGDLAESQLDGNWRTARDNRSTGSVRIDNSAQAVAAFEEPVPCPKIRGKFETRWNCLGHWEKLNKKGWVKA